MYTIIVINHQMLSPGPSYIYFTYMQPTTSLIFILVLVLQPIGLGFTVTILMLSNIHGYKFPGSHPTFCTLTWFFYHSLLLSFTFKFPLLSFLELFFFLFTTVVQPTSPSFTYFTPISPFLISTVTEPQSSSLGSPQA